MNFLFFSYSFFFQDGRTPLYVACWKGHVDIAKLLLEKKANVDLPKKVSGRNDICDDLCGFFRWSCLFDCDCFVLSDE